MAPCAPAAPPRRRRRRLVGAERRGVATRWRRGGGASSAALRTKVAPAAIWRSALLDAAVGVGRSRDSRADEGRAASVPQRLVARRGSRRGLRRGGLALVARRRRELARLNAWRRGGSDCRAQRRLAQVLSPARLAAAGRARTPSARRLCRRSVLPRRGRGRRERAAPDPATCCRVGALARRAGWKTSRTCRATTGLYELLGLLGAHRRPANASRLNSRVLVGRVLVWVSASAQASNRRPVAEVRLAVKPAPSALLPLVSGSHGRCVGIASRLPTRRRGLHQRHTVGSHSRSRGTCYNSDGRSRRCRAANGSAERLATAPPARR